MPAYALYNEIDDFAADWLENLIDAGLIAPGVVDRRSIEDLRGDDLRGFRQVHLFAGIGVWSYALRRAGVPDDFPLWTGSCPCQPFSAAGKGGGVDDERHLWPAMFHLASECRPPVMLGEQVASKDGLGWLDLVQADMEAADYAFGAVDTCSAGSGAPHIRQRLRFSAYDTRLATDWMEHLSRLRREQWRPEPGWGRAASGCGVDGVGDSQRCVPGWRSGEASGSESEGGSLESASHNRSVNAGQSVSGRLDDRIGTGLEGHGSGYCPSPGQWERSLRSTAATGELVGMAHDDDGRQSNLQRDGHLRVVGGTDGERSRAGFEPERSDERSADAEYAIGREIGVDRQDGHYGQNARRAQAHSLIGTCGEVCRPGPTNGFWRDADWLFCRDGKWRPVEPGTFPLAHGLPRGMGTLSPELRELAEMAGLDALSLAGAKRHRIGSLRGYGNAIDAEATVDFIRACFGSDDRVVDSGVEDLLV